jgi:hypothetical protein
MLWIDGRVTRAAHSPARIGRMRRPLAILIATLLTPLAAFGATLPYKEVMKESVKSKQPTVHARAGEYGFGVQYWRQSPTGSGRMGFVGGLVGGFAGGMLGSGLDRIANSGSTDLAQDDAERLAPLYDRAAAQRELENALTETLRTLPLFEGPVAIKPLADGAPLAVTAFADDPVLVVELYSSLITDYRGLQVTALVYELSAAEQAANPSASQAGRVYRNRFDYVSDLLPAPHVKTAEEIKADVEAVKAKYQGRRLTQQEQAQKKEELLDAKYGTTLDEWREPLMEAWLANDGAKLHEALKLGTAKVIELLAKDLLDLKPVEIRKVDKVTWRTLRDVESGRYTSIFVGGPFAGALLSEPSGLSVEYCQGTAFSESLPKDGRPRLCPDEQ